MNSELREKHPDFFGNWQDLEQFTRLAGSPIRSPERSQALERWEKYKKSRQIAYITQDERLLTKGSYITSLIAPAIDLRGASLDGITLGYADLRGVRLDKASLRGAWLKGAKLENCSLRSAKLTPLESGRNARLLYSDLSRANLEGADLEEADLSGTELREANLNDANLKGVDLSYASMVGTHLRGTELSGCRVYGISAWDVDLDDDESKRRELIVTPFGQSDVRVDDLEVAQFIYLLLNREKLRNVLDAVTRKGVLLLGRFGEGGLEVLRAIAERLRGLGYLPIIFDFARPQDRNYTETVKTLVGMSRFVIVDLSGPSVPQELYSTVPHYKIPFIPILESGRRKYAMFADLLEYPWVLEPVVEFESVKELLEQIPEGIVRPAEERIAIRQKRLAALLDDDD